MIEIMGGCLAGRGASSASGMKIYYASSRNGPPLLFGHATGARTHYQAPLEGCNDARTGMPPGIPRGAMCVQRFDDSLNSAIHITYRISLRSSSMLKPRDSLLKVFDYLRFHSDITDKIESHGPPAGARRPRSRWGANPEARQSN